MLIETQITKNNIMEIAECLIANAKNADYNSLCFGSSDIKFYLASIKQIENFYDDMFKVGFDPIKIFEELQNKYEFQMEYKDDDLVNFDLKSSIDDSISFNTLINTRLLEKGRFHITQFKKVN